MSEIKMPEHIARIIVEMEVVCDGEGQGPKNSELLIWIAEKYPALKKEFPHLNWYKET